MLSGFAKLHVTEPHTRLAVGGMGCVGCVTKVTTLGLRGRSISVPRSSVLIQVRGVTQPPPPAQVTKALEAVDGVTSATVDFKSETAVVTGDADADALVAAVVAAGKRASIRE